MLNAFISAVAVLSYITFAAVVVLMTKTWRDDTRSGRALLAACACCPLLAGFGATYVALAL